MEDGFEILLYGGERVIEVPIRLTDPFCLFITTLFLELSQVEMLNSHLLIPPCHCLLGLVTSFLL